MATRLFAFTQPKQHSLYLPHRGRATRILGRLTYFLMVAPWPVAAVRAALKSAGVIFVDENGGGPGVRLRKAPQGTEGLGK